jgi:hypothetical protein
LRSALHSSPARRIFAAVTTTCDTTTLVSGWCRSDLQIAIWRSLLQRRIAI